jgi:hypothetical protein
LREKVVEVQGRRELLWLFCEGSPGRGMGGSDGRSASEQEASELDGKVE